MHPRDLRDARILIADDEPANVALLEGLLADEGYRRIRSTCDARQVVPMTEAEEPDLILLDLHMPHLSGFDVMRLLRERLPSDAFLPILVLTADVTPAARERALAGGARDFLTKPIDAVEVGLRIRNLLEVRELHLHQRAQRAAAERAAAGARLLAEVSRVLGTSFDYDTMLGQVARTLVPNLGELCLICIASPDSARVAALAHVDPERERELRAGLDDGVRAGRVATMLDRLLLESAGTYDAAAASRLLDALTDLGLGDLDALTDLGPGEFGAGRPGAALIAPLTGSAGAIGSILLLSREERADATEDASVIEKVAYRAAVAVQNARLYHQAQEARRARDEMLGVVAHDLRNPLNTVILSAELLLETAAAHDQTGRRTLDIILRSARSMNAMIEDLLEIRRLETAGLRIQRVDTDLAELVHQAAEMLEPLARSRKLALRAAAAELPTVEADPPRLHQVLSNLVGNAIKFTPPGGEVAITAELVRDEVVVRVTDSGPGIPPDHLPHLFTPFWQARAGDRRGLGLGLVIARGIVEAHGGRIWAESMPGQGATFTFTLPCPRPLPPQEPQTAAEPALMLG